MWNAKEKKTRKTVHVLMTAAGEAFAVNALRITAKQERFQDAFSQKREKQHTTGALQHLSKTKADF